LLKNHFDKLKAQIKHRVPLYQRASLAIWFSILIIYPQDKPTSFWVWFALFLGVWYDCKIYDNDKQRLACNSVLIGYESAPWFTG
jgi:hypothetical protein